MKKAEKVFNVVVSIAVILTGAGFGTFTGFVYSEESYWWAGLIAGAVTAFALAKLYLWLLAKTFNGHNRMGTWFLGTFIAILCGVVCTTVVHGVMALIIHSPENPITGQMEGFWPIVVIVGEIIGAGTGLIVGGICSLVYVLKIKGEHRETA